MMTESTAYALLSKPEKIRAMWLRAYGDTLGLGDFRAYTSALGAADVAWAALSAGNVRMGA